MIGSVIRILAAFAAAFFTGKAVSRLKLPSILGWLIAGMVLGPHGVNLLDNALLNSGPYTAMTHIFECAVGLMVSTLYGFMLVPPAFYYPRPLPR